MRIKFMPLSSWHRRIPFSLRHWLIVIGLGYFAGRIAVNLVSMVDPERLVPISAESIIQSIPFTLFLYLLGIVLVSLRQTPPNRISLFTIAFSLRVIIGITLAFTFQYDDERGFHEAGIEQVYGLLSWGAGKGYYHLINILYAIFGPNLLLPKAMNAFLGSLLPFFTYDLGKHFFDSKAGWRAFLFTAFLPPLVIFSAVNLKEIATALLLVLILWFLAIPRRNTDKIVGALISLSLLYWLRGTVLALVGMVGVITYIVLGEKVRLNQLLQLHLWLKIAFVVALFVFFLRPVLIEPIIKITLNRMTRETYFVERFVESQATIMRFVDVSGLLSPKNLIILFLRGLFSPSPLRFLFDRDLGTIIEALNMLVWYLLFPFAVISFLAERQKGAILACGVIILGVLAISTMGIMVGSDPYRHRMMMFGLLFSSAAGSLKWETFRRFRWIFYLWWIGAFMFIGVWIMFRVS